MVERVTDFYWSVNHSKVLEHIAVNSLKFPSKAHDCKLLLEWDHKWRLCKAYLATETIGNLQVPPAPYLSISHPHDNCAHVSVGVLWMFAVQHIMSPILHPGARNPTLQGFIRSDNIEQP